MKLYLYQKILIFILLGLNLTNANVISHNPYSNTGHEQFSELKYVNDEYMILKDYSNMMIEKSYSKVQRKAFGWSVYMEREYADATYVGAIVFSRSNKTLTPFTFTYSLTEVTYEEQSYSITGSLSLKQSAKLKKVELSAAESIEVKMSGESSLKTTESNTMSITVNPNKKITLRISGECKISLGFAKYYFIGMCTKKGVFECVDVVTSYFELYEEDA